MAQPERAECLRCRHYYVTYEPARPHGCRHFGFVSRRLPELEVAAASGQPCGACEPRALPGAGPAPADAAPRGGRGPAR